MSFQDHWPDVAEAYPCPTTFYQFPALPLEIRLIVFNFAFNIEPRVVEMHLRGGSNEVYASTPQPPLLHVNRESRELVLRFYKPWLFPDSPSIATYYDILPCPLTIKNLDARFRRVQSRPFTCLANVCFDLERDTLLINKDLEILLELGRLEVFRLRKLALNADLCLKAKRGDWDHKADTLDRARHYLYFAKNLEVVTFHAPRENKVAAIGIYAYFANGLSAPDCKFVSKLSLIGLKRGLHWNEGHQYSRRLSQPAYSAPKLEGRVIIPEQIFVRTFAEGEIE
jgi:hypothetical protein